MVYRTNSNQSPFPVCFLVSNLIAFLTLEHRKTPFHPAFLFSKIHLLYIFCCFLLFFFFFNCYLAVPRPTLGHSQGDSLPNLMLIIAYVHIRPEGHREPHNKVGSLSPAEHLAGFELGTFRFLFQRLGHFYYEHSLNI